MGSDPAASWVTSSTSAPLISVVGSPRVFVARYGCPHGSLCAELDKRGDGPGMAAELMRAPVEWIRRQFEAMGRQDASDLAVHLLARHQGAALLTSTFRDPDLMAREAAHAAQWIDALDLSRTEAAYSIRSQFFQLPRMLAAPPASQVIDGSKLGMAGSSVPSFS